MKIDVIAVGDLDDYFRFQRLKVEFLNRLKRIEELSEQKVKLLEETKKFAGDIKLLKQKHKMTFDTDLTKEVMKYAFKN